jgi:DNA-binding LacI/PurR family transcriptional regulator
VQKVAEELGYRPHLAARSLRQAKSRHIRRIDQPALPPSVSVVEPWLVVRGSTSRPSGG